MDVYGVLIRVGAAQENVASSRGKQCGSLHSPPLNLRGAHFEIEYPLV